MNRFPTMLRTLRKQLKLTQPELADRLGISRSAISMYESGQREPSFATLEAFADFFGVDMNVLMGESRQTRSVTVPELKFALFGDENIDDDVYQEVLAFAKFAKERKGKPD